MRYLTINQIIDKKDGILPVSRSTFWRMTKSEGFPKAVKLSDRISAWQASEILDWIKRRQEPPKNKTPPSEGGRSLTQAL